MSEYEIATDGKTPLDDARKCIYEIIVNRNQIRISIPAQPHLDHDLRISRAISWAEERITELEAERDEAIELVKALRSMFAGLCISGPSCDAADAFLVRIGKHAQGGAGS